MALGAIVGLFGCSKQSSIDTGILSGAGKPAITAPAGDYCDGANFASGSTSERFVVQAVQTTTP